MGGFLKIRGSLFYKIHGLHVKKNIYHYKKVVANVRKLWLRLSGHLLFVEKSPLQKGGVQRLLFVVFWGPDRSIFIYIFFGSKKKPKNPFARVPRTKPEALVHFFRQPQPCAGQPHSIAMQLVRSTLHLRSN